MSVYSKYLLPFLIVFGGCQMLSVLAYDHRSKTKAQHTFSKGEKVVILVDDYLCPANISTLKPSLARRVSHYLMETRAVRPGDLVSVEIVNDLPRTSPDGRRLSIQNIGAQAEADYVIYVNLIDFNMQPDSFNPLIQPRARAYVKVIEVESGERVWPIDMAGEPIEVGGRMEPRLLSDTSKTSDSIDRLIDQLGLRVVQLFVAHHTDR